MTINLNRHNKYLKTLNLLKLLKKEIYFILMD